MNFLILLFLCHATKTEVYAPSTTRRLDRDIEGTVPVELIARQDRYPAGITIRSVDSEQPSTHGYLSSDQKVVGATFQIEIPPQKGRIQRIEMFTIEFRDDIRVADLFPRFQKNPTTDQINVSNLEFIEKINAVVC